MEIIYKMKKILLFILIFSISCTNSSDDNDDSFSPSNISGDSKFEAVAEYSDKTDANGNFSVVFNLGENVSAFQLITKVEGEEIGATRVISPSGEIIFNGDTYYSNYQTDGKQFDKNINTFNFPVSTTSSNLEAGTYTVNFKIKSKKSGVSTSSSLVIKSDTNKSNGVVNLNVIFMGSVANSEELIKHITNALDSYSIVTLNRAGIVANVNYYSYPKMPSILPDPRAGDAIYESVANAVPSGINLFMGADIENFSASDGHSGVSASVPGPVLPTKKSAIAFSINKAVGRDGEFNGRGNSGVDNDEKETDEGDEVRLFSDSISHEIFHYLGLRNSVEFIVNTVAWGDGLNSEKCVEKSRCEDIKNARENVMYPYPIKHQANTYNRNYYWFVRNIVSSDQRMVANKWVGVN